MQGDNPIISLFEPAMYRISVVGKLDQHWADYCGGMTITYVKDLHHHTRTILTGPLTDQSALIGVLTSLYDLGCPIVFVECMSPIVAKHKQ